MDELVPADLNSPGPVFEDGNATLNSTGAMSTTVAGMVYVPLKQSVSAEVVAAVGVAIIVVVIVRPLRRPSTPE